MFNDHLIHLILTEGIFAVDALPTLSTPLGRNHLAIDIHTAAIVSVEFEDIGHIFLRSVIKSMSG